MNKYESGIVELLKQQGLSIDTKLENTINMMIYEVCETAKETGIKEGINLGIKRACKEFELKISTMKSKIEE